VMIDRSSFRAARIPADLRETLERAKDAVGARPSA
jgi:acyl-CoA thioesterase FadM